MLGDSVAGEDRVGVRRNLHEKRGAGYATDDTAEAGTVASTIESGERATNEVIAATRPDR